MIASLVAVWAGIATLVISGPAALPTKKDGPFCKFQDDDFSLTGPNVIFLVAISGYWCWISDQYLLSRIT